MSANLTRKLVKRQLRETLGLRTMRHRSGWNSTGQADYAFTRMDYKEVEGVLVTMGMTLSDRFESQSVWDAGNRVNVAVEFQSVGLTDQRRRVYILERA